MDSISSSIPSAADSTEDYTIPMEAITLLQVVNPSDLICPLSKRTLTEGVQLYDCGHYFNKQAIAQLPFCPLTTCGRPIKSFVSVPLLQKIAYTFQNLLSKPNQQLKNKLDEKVGDIKEPADKKKIQEALNVFFKGGTGLNQGVRSVSVMLIGNENAHLYLPIFNLMNTHLINARTKLTGLIARLPAVRSIQPQPSIAPLPASSTATSRPVGEAISIPNGGTISTTLPSSLTQLASSMASSMRQPFPNVVNPTPIHPPINHGSVMFLPFQIPANMHNFTQPIPQHLQNAISTTPQNLLSKTTTAPQTTPTAAPQLPSTNGASPKSPPAPTNVPSANPQVTTTPNKEREQTPSKPKLTIKFTNSLRKSTNLETSQGVPSTETSTLSSSSSTSSTGASTTSIDLASEASKDPEVPSLPATPPATEKESQTSSEVPKTQKRLIHEIPANATPNGNPGEPLAKRLRSNGTATTTNHIFDLDEESHTEEFVAEIVESQKFGDNLPDVFITRVVIPTHPLPIKEEPQLEAAAKQDRPPAIRAGKGTPEKLLIKTIKEQERSHVYKRIKQANVNAYDKKGNTPLHYVIPNYEKTEGLINALFERGVNLDAQNSNKETALHWAAKKGKAKSIILLRTLGASTDIQDKDGKRPIDVATNRFAKTALTEALPLKKT